MRPAAQRGRKTIAATHLGHPLPLVMHEHDLVARLEHLGAVGQHHHHAHQHGRRQCPARSCGLLFAGAAPPARTLAGPRGRPVVPGATAPAPGPRSARRRPSRRRPRCWRTPARRRRATAQWPGSEGLYLDNQEELAQAVENQCGESACGARAPSSAPQRRARAAEGNHKKTHDGGRAFFQLAAARASGLGAAPEFQGGTRAPFPTLGFRGLLTRHG